MNSDAVREVLLEAGADEDDAKSGSPLICAASHGDADVVRTLLPAGADVRRLQERFPSTGGGRFVPLGL